MIDEPPGRAWRRIAGPLFLYRALGQALEFVGWIVLARRVGAAAFGVTSLAFLVARYAGLLSDWGASYSGARDAAADDDLQTHSRALVRRRQALGTGLTAAFVGGCFVVGRPELAPLAAVVVMIGMSRDWVALGRHDGRRAALPTLVQGSVLLIAVAFMSSAEQPALAIGLGYGAAAATSISLNRLPRQHSRHTKARVPLQPWMLVAVLAGQLLSSADILLLGAFETSASVGVYAAVYRLPNAWLAAVSILGAALLPLTTRSREDTSELARLRRSSLRVSCSAALALLALSPAVFWAVPVVFGDDYRSGQWPVVILLVSTAVATASAPLHQLYLATGRDRVYALCLSTAAGVLVTASLVLIPPMEMAGAAVATLIAHTTLAGCLTVAVRAHEPSRSRSP
jgi:O-antigen/teichoic acid export membrane protein